MPQNKKHRSAAGMRDYLKNRVGIPRFDFVAGRMRLPRAIGPAAPTASLDAVKRQGSERQNRASSRRRADRQGGQFSGASSALTARMIAKFEISAKSSGNSHRLRGESCLV
jgi:hypothetical protein